MLECQQPRMGRAPISAATKRRVKRLLSNARSATQLGAINVIRRTWFRVTPGKLQRTLEAFDAGWRESALVHSSLAACGYLVGGSKTVVDGVKQTCSTLCVPTNAYYYPKQQSDLGPVFDPRTSPSKVGKITEYFRQLRSTIHKIHLISAIARR